MGSHLRNWAGDTLHALFTYDYLFLRTAGVVDQLRRLSLTHALLVGLLIWLGVVRIFRWKRYNAIHREYGPKWNDGKGGITPEEAQRIVNLSTLYDMPLLTYYALSFGLVGSYAIPTISKLLYSTKQVKSPEAISRRYVDTEIFVTTWLNCPISGFVDLQAREKGMSGDKQQPAEDPRAMIALARVNYLHSQYKIDYEERCRVPCQESHDLTDSTLDDILPVPTAFGIKALAKKMLLCFVDAGMRNATMFETPAWYIYLLVNITMSTVAFCQRWLMLPEFSPRSIADMDIVPEDLKDMRTRGTRR
ncbi:hypothetical protein NLJ89_g4467 [Agrocybe chaxingu]|uniref:Uncharacterized protein n=1 Tax=Agrocybe chaxingu TaxID=84603 RepID=A0A9W8K389_9AGAR|nr:hypothetical protein NLJ89_g4467 [Agrocybe chaxingu]